MQITKAMELVASSPSCAARKERVEASRPYFETLYATLIATSPRLTAIRQSVYLARRAVTNRCLYIVIAGDRGLAGGYNANIFKASRPTLRGSDYRVLPIGKKAARALRAPQGAERPDRPCLRRGERSVRRRLL